MQEIEKNPGDSPEVQPASRPIKRELTKDEKMQLHNRRAFYRTNLKKLMRKWRNLRGLLPDIESTRPARIYLNAELKKCLQLRQDEPDITKRELADTFFRLQDTFIDFSKEIIEAKKAVKEEEEKS